MLWAILDFFLHTPDFLPTCTLHYAKKKKINKKILQITIYEKSKNFTVIVSQMRVLGQKNYRGGGAKRPPPSLFRVNSFV